MALNPNISLAVRGIELQDPLAQYGKFAAIQGAQNQNQLAQMQMQEYERTRAEEEGLRNYLAQSDLAKPETRAGLVRYGKSGLAYGTALGAQEKAALEQQETRGKIAKSEVDIAAARMKQARDLLPSVASPEMYAIWRSYTLQNLPNLAGVIPEQYSPDTVRNLMLEADKALEQHFVSQNLGPTTRVVAMPKYGPGAARIVQGTEARIGMAPGEADRIRNEGLRIGLEGRRVAVAEESQRQAADPDFQQRMAGAKAVGEAIAKGDVAAQQTLPNIISRAEEGLRLIDELVGKPEVRDKNNKITQPGTAPHAGFQGSVGATYLPGSRFVPGTDEAGFMSRFDQIKGASFLEAFEALKGGGSITEKEGTKATDAINRMSISTDEKEFMTAARDLQKIIRTGIATAQARAARAGVPAAPDPLGLR
jgi:hypothetical protein